MEIEIWKPVVGFEGKYEVSNLGRIKSLKRNVFCRGYKTRTIKEYILLGSKDDLGYIRINLRNGEKVQYLVHRIVAKSFIDNPNNYPYVMHLDNNPSNNRVDNLKWGTQKQNIQQASRENRMTTKSIKQLTLNGDLIKIWNSAMDVKRELGIHQAGICMCLKGKRNHAGGFLWRYI